MYRYLDPLRADRARADQHEQTAPLRTGQAAGDIDTLRPIRAVRRASDYWSLQERRREDAVGDLFQRLAYPIRAEPADRLVVDDRDLPPGIVT